MTYECRHIWRSRICLFLKKMKVRWKTFAVNSYYATRSKFVTKKNKICLWQYNSTASLTVLLEIFSGLIFTTSSLVFITTRIASSLIFYLLLNIASISLILALSTHQFTEFQSVGLAALLWHTWGGSGMSLFGAVFPQIIMKSWR